jgi:hypothetical protein
MDIDALKYPIGTYTEPISITADEIEKSIGAIASFPLSLQTAVKGWSGQQLDTPYRPGGWTIRQLVHHCADSHMNAFIRHKLALTEEEPVIKPYAEALWAELPDAKTMDVASSLQVLDGLHKRWVYLLSSLTDMQLERMFFHPGLQKKMNIKSSVCMYAWHCSHHLAHTMQLKEAKSW